MSRVDFGSLTPAEAEATLVALLRECNTAQIERALFAALTDTDLGELTTQLYDRFLGGTE